MLSVDLMLTPLSAKAESPRTAQDYNPELNSFAVLSQAPTTPFITEVKDVQELLADIDWIELVRGVGSKRKVFLDAIILGVGVVESNNSEAVGEV
jgi:hypothetical protein